LKTGCKPQNEHNPLILQRFGADPYVLVHNGRLYLYMTNDTLEYDEQGNLGPNTYLTIKTLNIFSSEDLVNWTDHGTVKIAGEGGIAPWVRICVAPAAVCKEINGKMKFFLFFGNGPDAVCVLTSDSPTGPFADELKGPLVTRDTPNCEDVKWLFDPAVLMDTDGRSYLYFGGGVPEGKEAAPGTARAVELAADLLSIVGEPVTIDAPYMFEDSGINKFGDTYYYSYSTHFWIDKEGGEAFRLKMGEIAYMTSKSPLGPFKYEKTVLKNPGELFGIYGNNHHCMFEFNGKRYIAYHTQTLERAMGFEKGYRSTFINEINVLKSGEIEEIRGTMQGVKQVKAFDPYLETSGGTMASMAGMTTEETAQGETAAVSLKKDAWLLICGADFKNGAKALAINAKTDEDTSISVVPDSLDGECVGEISLRKSDGFVWQRAALNCPVCGTRDVYFVCHHAAIKIASWRFERA